MLLRDLQSTANRQHMQAPMTWQAINNSLRSQGNPEIGYDEFAARWDADPILKQLVDRFDGHGLVVKTDAKEQPEQGQKKTNAMGQMAKRATDKAFK
jgi:hypothetical protein